MGRKNQHRRALLAAMLAAGLAPMALAARREGPHVVGYLSSGPTFARVLKALAALGYIEGTTLRVETRREPDAGPALLARYAQELVAAKPDALFAYNGDCMLALAAATRTIPIVCGGVPDPVGMGFAKSLRAPGGNVTGLSYGNAEAAEIVVRLMVELRPGLRRIGSMYSTGIPADKAGGGYAAACRAAGLEWVLAPVSSPDDVERALKALASQAVFLGPMRGDLGDRALATATRLKIATRGSVDDGALVEYGLVHHDAPARIAAILDKVLRGADPATIPFELPGHSFLRINRATARAIGVEIPRGLLLRANEVVG